MQHKDVISRPYRKWARFTAILWTLLIFFLCFLPAEEIPDVDIPLVDKWTHLLLFAVFAFLWLASFASLKASRYLLVFVLAVLDGWLVELIQGQLAFLHRSQDNMDILADSIGGLLGVLIFYIFMSFYGRKMKREDLR